MNRFSEKLERIINEQDFCFDPEEIRTVEMALGRFKSYEDTGMTPKEIEAQKAYRIDGMPLKRFVEILTAEIEGRLLICQMQTDKDVEKPVSRLRAPAPDEQYLLCLQAADEIERISKERDELRCERYVEGRT